MTPAQVPSILNCNPECAGAEHGSVPGRVSADEEKLAGAAGRDEVVDACFEPRAGNAAAEDVVELALDPGQIQRRT